MSSKNENVIKIYKNNKNVLKVIEYRCRECKTLLFVGSLEKGSYIKIICKKSIKKESQEESKKVYRKCKTIREIEV